VPPHRAARRQANPGHHRHRSTPCEVLPLLTRVLDEHAGQLRSQDRGLIGGTGNDRLTGGLGNDTFVVDAAGDLVIEAAGQGTDTVRSATNHTFAANVENLALMGTAALNGAGNALANVMTGNNSTPTAADIVLF